MTILADNSVKLTTVEIDLCKEATHRLATVLGKNNFLVSSIIVDCIDTLDHAVYGNRPQVEIRSSDGLYLVHFWQCHFFSNASLVFPVNGLSIKPGNEIELRVTQPAYQQQFKVKVTIAGEFNDMAHTMTPIEAGDTFISGAPVENSWATDTALGYLQQLIAKQNELSHAVNTYLQHKTETPVEPGIMEATENANQNPCSEVPMSEVKQEKDLDNSLWSELPDEIREAAEKAGIGLEDLHEMVKDYTTLKEGAAQQERLLSFCAKDNFETRRPIVLAKIEAEKELKLAKIQSDAEVAKAEAASKASAAVAIADQKSRRAVQIGSTFRHLFVGTSVTATLSYIAYCVSGIFM